MKEYFLLQAKLLGRRLSSFGINPFLGLIICLIGFVVLSYLLFERISYSKFIYPLIPVLWLIYHNDRKRNDFLKLIFEARFRTVRILENLLVAFPFILYLVFQKHFLEAVTCSFIAIILAYFDPVSKFNIIIPTPFGKKPFEFIRGFRKTILSIVIGYLVCIIGVATGNFNISAFSLIFLFLVFLTFYSEPENEYFVWIFKKNSARFLMYKILIAIYHSTLILLPAAVLSLIYFREFLISAIIILVGYLALSTMILAKYSAFPNTISIPHFILFALSIQFPPLLIFVIPFFYTQSINKLNRLLK